MIKVEGLTKFFGNVPAVEDVSFEVESGEIVGFLGPNGAGKSTTMRILTGFMPPTAGRVWVAGFDVSAQPLEAQRRIGYLPESNPLYRDMTVTSYLDFVASIKGMRGAEKAAAIERVIESCGLKAVSMRLIGHCSKGYRQRVGVAQALVSDPPVLILDEPTEGLDPAQIVEIRSLIRGLKGERTIILSTHILPEVSLVCDRVIVIHQGRIAAQGGLDTLESDIRKDEIVRVGAIGDAETIRQRLAAVAGVKSVSLRDTGPSGQMHMDVRADQGREVRPELAEAVGQAGGQLVELVQERLTLEDLFVQIVSSDRRHTMEGTDA